MIGTVRAFELELASPFGSAQGTIDRGQGLLFDVFDKPAGLGEATALPPFTESAETCREILEAAAEAYTDSGWREAMALVSSTTDGELDYPAARHAVSLAYLDQQAREAHLPLFRHIGGDEVASTVPIEATIGDHPTGETMERAEAAVEAGYPAVKLKVGNRPVRADETRVRAVRTAVGPEIEVRLDVNGAWTLETARTFIDRTADLELDFIEQPLEPGSFEGHHSLRGRGVDIALDESVSLYPVSDLLAAGAGDVYVIKPMTIGGVDLAYGTAVELGNEGYRVVFSTTVESVVGRTGAIHGAAAVGDIEPSGLGTGEFVETDLAADPITFADGKLTIPEDPGLGIDDIDLD